VPLAVPALGEHEHRDADPGLGQLSHESRPVAVGQVEVDDRHVYTVEPVDAPADLGQRAGLGPASRSVFDSNMVARA
jgi:hypothetical protein